MLPKHAKISIIFSSLFSAYNGITILTQATNVDYSPLWIACSLASVASCMINLYYTSSANTTTTTNVRVTSPFPINYYTIPPLPPVRAEGQI